jgi:CO dehydrogenase maturation factor
MGTDLERTIARDGPIIVSVAGKGGTGKTSVTALLLRTILMQGDFDQILVIDADPASNVPDILGVERTRTIGSIVDHAKKALEPGGKFECKPLRDEILRAIAQGAGFDYLVMGRTSGKGCYCLLNSLLTQSLEEFVKLYDFVVIDFDAGLEHFSRHTDNKSDILIVVTDPSKMGFETAKRIAQLSEEIGYNYRGRFLLGCGFTDAMIGLFSSYAADTGLTPLGAIPFDGNLLALNLEGKSVFELDPESISYRSVTNLWKVLRQQFFLNVKRSSMKL